MANIYHLVPKKIYGNELIPLNQLKNQFPEVYSAQITKYQGREKILQRTIPKIDCLWNDVLHFSSISPQIIFSHLQQLGFGPFPNLKWYEIPVENIKTLPTVVYQAPPEPRPDFLLTENDVEIFDAATWKEPKTLTSATIQYFLTCKHEGKSPLSFQFVPHVLAKGRVNIEGTNKMDFIVSLI